MGFVKKIVKKITGADKAEKEAERQRREAEEAARKQAELAAAQTAATAQAGAGPQESKAEIEGDTASAQKKKIKGGRKGLTVARSGGSGINI